MQPRVGCCLQEPDRSRACRCRCQRTHGQWRCHTFAQSRVRRPCGGGADAVRSACCLHHRAHFAEAKMDSFISSPVHASHMTNCCHKHGRPHHPPRPHRAHCLPERASLRRPSGGSAVWITVRTPVHKTAMVRLRCTRLQRRCARTATCCHQVLLMGVLHCTSSSPLRLKPKCCACVRECTAVYAGQCRAHNGQRTVVEM